MGFVKSSKSPGEARGTSYNASAPQTSGNSRRCFSPRYRGRCSVLEGFEEPDLELGERVRE